MRSSHHRPGASLIWRLMLWFDRGSPARGIAAYVIWVAAIAAGYSLAGCSVATIAGATWFTLLGTGAIVVALAFYAGDPPRGSRNARTEASAHEEERGDFEDSLSGARSVPVGDQHQPPAVRVAGS